MYFLDSTDDNKHEYNQNGFARFHNQIIGTGVSDVESLEVSAKNNMEIALSSGWIFANGYALEIENTETLKHEVADPDNDRIDRIVIRFDTNPEKLDFYPVIKKGTPAGRPTPPSLTRDNYIYEMSVAQVRIKAGKSYVEDDEITDERENDAVCGYIPLHNIYRGMQINELGMVTMPNQSYVEMYDKTTIQLPSHTTGDDDDSYNYKDIPFKPDIDRQNEIKNGKFVAKQDGAYLFTIHTRLEDRLPTEPLAKFEISLVVNGDDEKDAPIGRRDDNVERFFNNYGPMTQATGFVAIFLEKGDKAELKAGIRQMEDGAKISYVRSSIAKLN